MYPFYCAGKLNKASEEYLKRSYVGDIGFLYKDITYTTFNPNNIKRLEDERAIWRGIIECGIWEYRKAGAYAKFPSCENLISYTRNYLQNVWGTNAINETGVSLSLNRLAHIVYWTIYKDSPKYDKFIKKFYEEFQFNYYFPYAFEVAKLSSCHKLSVGAILVAENGDIIYKAHNSHPKNTRCDNICLRKRVRHGTDISVGYCIHAEMNLLLHNNEFKNSSIYLTHAPCRMCARLMLQAGIKNVFFIHENNPADGVEYCWQLGGPTCFIGV